MIKGIFMEKITTKEKYLSLYIKKISQFNIFKVLGLQKGSENRHSNIIAWLLSPEGSHNFGIQFLSNFLKSIDNYKTNNYKFQNVSITREDTIENGRPDIIVENDEFICIIEVKFGAKETNYQCKRYFEHYKDLKKDKYFVFLDIDDENYEKLKNQKEYKTVNIDKFDFSKTYHLATFKKNILPNIKKLLDDNQNIDANLSGILYQYKNLLEEKYYLLNENEIKSCVDILREKGNTNKYSLPQTTPNIVSIPNVLHNFIWYTVPNRYNDTLLRILKDLNLQILLRWKENGSSLSLRCTDSDDNNYDYHDNKHLYFDHRYNKIVLNFQTNINNQSENKHSIEIVNENEYFENMLLSENSFYEKLKQKIESNIL